MSTHLQRGSILAACLALVACFDTSGDDVPPGGSPIRIESGNYTISGAELNPDECAFNDPFYGNFFSADVVVNPGRTSMVVDLEGEVQLTYNITGNDLLDQMNPGTAEIDCTEPGEQSPYACGTESPYNCIITTNINFRGMVTGTNEFTLVDTYEFSGSGAGCAAVSSSAGLPLPCETVDQADFAL